MTKPSVSHDFETYSDVDLKQVGAWAYSEHPSTRVISWAAKVDDTPPQIWYEDTLHAGIQPPLLADPTRVNWYAWNAFFEYCIWVNTLGWPAPPIDNWYCTQSLALALALPRDLATCGRVLRLPAALQKDKRGEELISLLCRPDKKTGQRNTDPVLLDELYDYNKQDTVAEQAIKHKLRPLQRTERRVWQIDLAMNVRGVPLDTQLLTHAATVYTAYKAPLKQRLQQLTGLPNPNSGVQFKTWLAEHGHPLPNLQKATVAAFLSTCDDAQLTQIVQWRSALARTPLTKYEKIAQKMGGDGRFHGALSYHMATTGRWSSTGVNFQNLNHPTLSPAEIETCIAALKTGDVDLVSALYEDPIEAMSSCLRGVMCATPGHRLIVADYKAIEARVIAWLANHEPRLAIFRTHGKIYEYAATQLFGVAELDSIEKDSPERFAGKVAELALGFQGGWRALINMAAQQGVDLGVLARNLGHSSAEAFAQTVVTRWRQANAAIVDLWYAVERAAIHAVSDPGIVHRVNNKLAFKYVPGMLLLQLPSGRQLAFFQPSLHEGRYGAPELRYWCVDAKTHKWGQKHSYGGDLTQSATQAVARDVMADALPQLVDTGYVPVMLIHDEIITEMPVGRGSLAEMTSIMCRTASWAAGLPVAADGFESVRYRKD